MSSITTSTALILLLSLASSTCSAWTNPSSAASTRTTSRGSPNGWSSHHASRLTTTSDPSSFTSRHHRRPSFTTSTSSSSSTLRMALLPVDQISTAYTYALANYKLAMDSATYGVLCGTADVIAQTRERIFGGGSSSSKDDDDDFNNAVVSSSAKELQLVTTTKSQQDGEEDNSFDVARCARFALKGLGGGIIWSNWYGLVDGWSLSLGHDLLQQFSWAASTLFHNPDQAEWLLQSDVALTVGRTASSIALEQFVACPLVYGLWDIPVPSLLNGTPPEQVKAQVQSKLPNLLINNAKVWTFVNVVVYNMPLEWRVVTMSTADLFWQSVVASVASEEEEEDGSSVENVEEQKAFSSSSSSSRNKSGSSLQSRLFEGRDLEDFLTSTKFR